MRALDDVVKQGKVRYIGCSNLAAWQIMKALGISEHKNLNKFTSVQAYYSLLGRDVEHELLPLINDQKLGLLVWGPLAAGFLSGKYTDSDTINKSRRDKFDFPPIDKKKAFNIIDVLSSIAKKYKVSVAQVSLSWLLSKPTVSSIITGVRNADQLMDNLSAINLSLSINDIEELDNVSTTYIPYPNWIQSNAIEIRTPT
ncbi:aldo/keto reductase [Citrobacter koseri]|uniref:aldo/keto reductase n=1 Tax=Citrobacter koseri TaxID=545 RepID=UPI00351090AE